MNTLGIDATPEEVELMVDEIDQDNSGEIEFEGRSAWRQPGFGGDRKYPILEGPRIMPMEKYSSQKLCRTSHRKRCIGNGGLGHVLWRLCGGIARL